VVFVYQIAQSAVIYNLLVVLALLIADLGRLVAGGRKAPRSQIAFLAFLGSAAGFAGVFIGRWEFVVCGIVAGFLLARWFGGDLRGAVIVDLVALLSILGVYSGGVRFDPRADFLLWLFTFLMGLLLLACSIGVGFLVLGNFKDYVRVFVVAAGLLAASLTVLLSYYTTSFTSYRGLLPFSLLSSSLLGLSVLSCFGVAGLPTMLGLGVVAWASPYLGSALLLQGFWSSAIFMPLIGVVIVLLYCFKVFERSRLYIGSLLVFFTVIGLFDPILLPLIPFLAGIIVRGRVFVLLALLGICLAYSFVGWTTASYSTCLDVVGVEGWSSPPIAAAGAAVAHSYFLFYPSIIDPVFARSLALSLANVSGSFNATLFSYIFGVLMYLHNLTASKKLLPDHVEVKGMLKLPGTGDYKLPIFGLGDGIRAELDTSLLPLCSPPAARLVRVGGGWLVDGVDYLVASVTRVDLQSVWDAVYGYLSRGELGNKSLQLLVYFALNNAYCDLLNQSVGANVTAAVDKKMPFEVAAAYIMHALNVTKTCVETELKVYKLAGGIVVFSFYVILLFLLPLLGVFGRVGLEEMV